MARAAIRDRTVAAAMARRRRSGGPSLRHCPRAAHSGCPRDAGRRAAATSPRCATGERRRRAKRTIGWIDCRLCRCVRDRPLVLVGEPETHTSLCPPFDAPRDGTHREFLGNVGVGDSHRRGARSTINSGGWSAAASGGSGPSARRWRDLERRAVPLTGFADPGPGLMRSRCRDTRRRTPRSSDAKPSGWPSWVASRGGSWPRNWGSRRSRCASGSGRTRPRRRLVARPKCAPAARARRTPRPALEGKWPCGQIRVWAEARRRHQTPYPGLTARPDRRGGPMSRPIGPRDDAAHREQRREVAEPGGARGRLRDTPPGRMAGRRTRSLLVAAGVILSATVAAVIAVAIATSGRVATTATPRPGPPATTTATESVVPRPAIAVPGFPDAVAIGHGQVWVATPPMTRSPG